MKFVASIILLLIFAPAYSQLSDAEIHDLKSGRVQTDRSHIYTLPFPKGGKHLLIQAYNSGFSHQGEISLDFKMKPGSGVCAARSGVVTSVKEDSDEGGLSNTYLSKGNHIIITHDDGSQAMYWHLQKDGAVVAVGDRVEQGQLIGYSGNTGYSAFPHLHFQVYDKDGKNIATRFYTRKGVIYLRPGKWYKRMH